MRTLLPSLSLFALFTLFACGGNQTDEASQESTHSPTPSANDFSDAIEQVQSQAAQLQEGEPLPFRELQEILPKQLNGLERTSKSGQTNGAMGFKISQAEAKYQTNEGESIEVEIFDTGGLKMGLMSMAAWASLEMDKEDDNGYERTSTIQGFKAFEKYNKRSQRCELSLLVKERFVVKATGKNMEMKTLKAAVKDLPLKKL
ncbi:MAG: hypothetical protein KTR30_19015 [Saprospiraceae bacterium]|nr:hypothetical protein [Saprospiraceae bacterium]